MHSSPDPTAEIGRLEALGAYDPAAPGIAAMVEAHRQAGDAAKALELADEGLAAQPGMVAVRVARALALIDLARLAEARHELTAVLDTVTDHPVAQALLSTTEGGAADEALADLEPGELEQAFSDAAPETEQMVSANDFAEMAIHAIDDEPDDEDLVPSGWTVEDPHPIEAGADFRATEDSPFANETVATLLEDQGHAAAADELRRELDPAHVEAVPNDLEPPVAEAVAVDDDDNRRVLPVLERWLENLRRRAD